MFRQGTCNHTSKLFLIAAFLICQLYASGQKSILDQIREVKRTYTYSALEGVNSIYADFSPAVLNDQLVFTSDREYDLLSTGENWWKKRPLLNLFLIDVKSVSSDSLEFSDPRLFEPGFMSESHTGPITFSPDGNLAVFTQVMSKKQKGDKKINVYKPMLLFSFKEAGKWTMPERLPFVDLDHSYGHGYIAADGKTLYFSSDREGGFGGEDIYKSEFIDGKWSDPKNLGNTINSSRDEVFPCFYDSRLYFSSDKSGGIGGLDIYAAELGDDGIFGKPKAIDGLNSSADDFGLAFTNPTTGFFSSDREGGVGMDDLYGFKIEESINVRSDFLAGQFTYRRLDGKVADSLSVMLVDETGKLVMETTTNDQGEFLFQNLDAQGSYILKIDGSEDLQLVIYDENGEKKAYLLSDSKGEFVYKLLNQQYVGTLALMDEDDIQDGLGDLNGQFIYENLPGKYADGLKVMLVDQDGNTVYTSITDEYGNFTFNNLPADENYMIRMEKLDDNLTLVIFNNDENVTAILRMDGQGDFVFRKLDQKYQSDLKMLELEDADLLSDLQGSIHGKFEIDNKPANLKEGIQFDVINDKGEVIDHAVTDENGEFRLLGLPLTESYIFRISEESPYYDSNLSLFVMNRQRKKVALLDRDKQGYFVYTPLGLSGPIDLTSMDMDNSDFDHLMKVPTIYYDADSYSLSAKSRKVLDTLVAELKANQNVKIEINSYADSRASEEYNLELSRKRTNSVIRYLRSKGISDSRLGGNAYGESKLLNDCGNGVKCPEALHQLNRRSEVRIYTVST